MQKKNLLLISRFLQQLVNVNIASFCYSCGCFQLQLIYSPRLGFQSLNSDCMRLCKFGKLFLSQSCVLSSSFDNVYISPSLIAFKIVVGVALLMFNIYFCSSPLQIYKKSVSSFSLYPAGKIKLGVTLHVNYSSLNVMYIYT